MEVIFAAVTSAADLVEGTVVVAAASTVVVKLIREVVDLIRGRFISVPAFIRGRFIPVPGFIRGRFNSACGGHAAT